jgi:2-C-methyl-D-erythritol 4-phosphate cytidylyltransferase
MARNIIAVVPAAGVGARMGADRPKQYLSIAGRTILEHSLAVLAKHPAISQIIVAVNPTDPYINTLNLSAEPKIRLVHGGATRAESVLNGLEAIADKSAWVLVHDAARPCLRTTEIDLLLEVKDPQGAILAIPVVDTIKRADEQGRIATTEDRRYLWQAQTPQFFPLQDLQRALSHALHQGLNITDEASAMEFAGQHPLLIAGRSDNIKITRPEDLALAAFYLTGETL